MIPAAWDPTRLAAPGGCLTCDDAEHGPLCPGCTGALEMLAGRGCRACGNPDVGDSALNCDWCARLTHLPDRVCTCFGYRETGREVYHLVKFRGYWRLMRPLVDLVQPAFFRQMDYPHIDCLIPIPETLGRKFSRDYNPAQLLARELSRFTGLPVRSLVTVNPFSRRQVGLDYEERRRNVRKRYRLKGKPPRSVVLVDDVVTTGATLEAITELLRKAGVQQVGWFSLFRTP